MFRYLAPLILLSAKLTSASYRPAIDLFSEILPTRSLLTYQTNLFEQDLVQTELLAYQLLQQHPLLNQIDYVAIPWAVFINQNRLSSLPEIQVNNGCTVCQHIRYEKIIPYLIKIGVKVLFTPHVDKDYDQIKVLPFPHLAINGIDPAPIKDIWSSFVGAEYTHFTRAQIFKLLASDPRFVLINRGKTWHFYLTPEKAAAATVEYQDVLARTRFALCPRGTGASTLRFWECLRAGAIPVLISDAMRLPDFWDWDNCMIRVPENAIDQIPAILAQITPQQEQQMRQSCLDAYAAFSGPNFVSAILNYYGA